MPFDSINNTRNNFPPRPRPRRLWLGWIMICLLLAVLAAGIFGVVKLITLGKKIFEGQKFSFGRLFVSSDRLLAGEENGEIKILLLGIAGKNHDGGNLADTMILATVKPGQTKNAAAQVSLFSIPRDMAAEIPGYGVKKINAAFAYGEAGEQRQGPALAVKTVENFLSTSIPYYAVVDFQGFADAVDHVGGIAVDVPVTFTDAQFPDGKNGYLAPLTFEAGRQTMHGERTLQYVRSRHGNNDQGSDFARSRRQQEMLRALKEKILDLNVFANLGLISDLMNDFADHFHTNLTPAEIKRLWQITRDLEQNNIVSHTLDGQSGLICDYISPDDGQYLLIPCAGFEDFGAIRAYWENQFILGLLTAENPKIEIQNADREESLAAFAANLLALRRLVVASGNFFGETVYEHTTVYDNTGGRKPHTLSYIKERLGAEAASGPFPFKNLTPGGADFVIIVAADIKK